MPSDLINFEGPVMSDIERQRIIYEDIIKDLNEDHQVESLLDEQIMKIMHDTIIEEYNNKLKQLEENVNEERSKVNLMLGQIKMFENDAKENEERMDELTNELSSERENLENMKQERDNLVQEKENWMQEKENWDHERENWNQERESLKSEIENLNFRNNETTCELNHNLEIYIQKKNEAEDYKKKLDAVKNQLTHYKRLAKNRDLNE